jgi:hypothetical protein
MSEGSSYESSAVYDRALLLHGSKRNQVLSLAEIEQYGLDSFADGRNHGILLGTKVGQVRLDAALIFRLRTLCLARTVSGCSR